MSAQDMWLALVLAGLLVTQGLALNEIHKLRQRLDAAERRERING